MATHGKDHAQMTPRSTPDARSTIRVRILVGSSIAIGPGKADLLAAIADTGSISAAARRMGMSYRRAWLLVHTMNTCFAHPLVEAEKGGPAGGGAAITPTGREVLEIYQGLVRLARSRLQAFVSPAAGRRNKAS